MDIRNTKEYKEMGYAVVSCPICERETLDSYWICEHCGWEYDGVTDEAAFSAANGATVGEYRLRYQVRKALREKKARASRSNSESVLFSPHPKQIVVTKKELRRQMLLNFANPNNLLQILVFGKNHPKFEERLTKVCIKLQTASSFIYRRRQETGKLSEREYERYLYDSYCENPAECRVRLEEIYRRDGLDPREISEELTNTVFEKFCAVKRYTLPMIANTAEYAYFSFFRHIILFVIEHDDCPEVKITGSYCYPDLPGMTECDVDFDY